MTDFEIFIKIILYLLLALAFFSKYFIRRDDADEASVKSEIILVFVFGIIAILFLIFAQINNWENKIWGYFFIAPFILMILHPLTRIFYKAINGDKKGMRGGWSFITGCGKIIKNLFERDTFIGILFTLAGIFSYIVFPSIEVSTRPIFFLEIAIFLILSVILNRILNRSEMS